MSETLPPPLTDYVGQIVDVRLRSRDGWQYGAKIVGVDLATQSLEVQTQFGTELVPALLNLFVFHQDHKPSKPIV